MCVAGGLFKGAFKMVGFCYFHCMLVWQMAGRTGGEGEERTKERERERVRGVLAGESSDVVLPGDD